MCREEAGGAKKTVQVEAVHQADQLKVAK